MSLSFIFLNEIRSFYDVVIKLAFFFFNILVTIRKTVAFIFGLMTLLDGVENWQPYPGHQN